MGPRIRTQWPVGLLSTQLWRCGEGADRWRRCYPCNRAGDQSKDFTPGVLTDQKHYGLSKSSKRSRLSANRASSHEALPGFKKAHRRTILCSRGRALHMITKFLLIMLLCLSFGSVVAQAQDIQTKGSISGTVADINGAVIQNARVTVTGEKTVNRIATTNE